MAAHYMVAYKVLIFGADQKFSMAARASNDWLKFENSSTETAWKFTLLYCKNIRSRIKDGHHQS